MVRFLSQLKSERPIYNGRTRARLGLDATPMYAIPRKDQCSYDRQEGSSWELIDVVTIMTSSALQTGDRCSVGMPQNFVYLYSSGPASTCNAFSTIVTTCRDNTHRYASATSDPVKCLRTITVHSTDKSPLERYTYMPSM